jgi:hypothetical protein
MTYKLRLESLKKYLLNKSWNFFSFTEKLSKISLVIEEEKFELIIPNSEEMLDYNSRIKDLICSLSFLEERNQTEIYEEIRNIGFDLMKFRFVAKQTKAGTIPLTDFVGVLNNVRNLITYSACSEIEPRSQYRGKLFSDAKELVENCEFAQTEAGSFVISIRVPLGKTYISKIDEDNDYLRDLGRKTITRIIDGINDAEQLSLDDEAEFRQSYDKKLNKNVCEAISRILIKEEGFDVEINAKWDSSIKPEKDLPKHSKIQSKMHFIKFNKMATYLKKIHEPEEITIYGTIKKLQRQEMDSESEKKLITIDVPSLKRNVYLYLKEDDHKSACNAYRDSSKVKVTGKLNKKTQHWFLDNPTNFNLINNQ